LLDSIRDHTSPRKQNSEGVSSISRLSVNRQIVKYGKPSQKFLFVIKDLSHTTPSGSSPEGGLTKFSGTYSYTLFAINHCCFFWKKQILKVL